MTQNALQSMFAQAPAAAPAAPVTAATYQPPPAYTGAPPVVYGAGPGMGYSHGPAPQSVDMFGGFSAGRDRFPRPDVGTYDLTVLQSGMTQTDGQDPYAYIDFQVDQSSNGTPPGSVVHFDQCMSPGARRVGGPVVKRAVQAIVGLDEAQLNAASGPAGDGRELIAAVFGMHSVGHNGQPYPANPLKGMKIRATITRGKDVTYFDKKTGQVVNTGDWYRLWAFSKIPA